MNKSAIDKIYYQFARSSIRSKVKLVPDSYFHAKELFKHFEVR